MEDKCITENKMGCSHECTFSKNQLAFTCVCPEGMELGQDMKTCHGPGESHAAAARHGQMRVTFRLSRSGISGFRSRITAAEFIFSWVACSIAPKTDYPAHFRSTLVPGQY